MMTFLFFRTLYLVSFNCPDQHIHEGDAGTINF